MGAVVVNKAKEPAPTTEAKDEAPEAFRRRLSVAHVDKSKDETEEEVRDDDRGGVLDWLDNATDRTNASGRRFSIGSDVDAGKASFADKKVTAIGNDSNHHGLGFTCRKGLKPESPNQDSWAILKVENDFALYGAFDGHGQKGHDVSNMVKNDLFKLIVKDPRFKTDEMPSLLKDAFKKMQELVATADNMKQINARLSGTTASVVIHDLQKKKLTIGHVADSTVCMASWKDESKKELICRALTRDHKPDLPDEKARIEKNGGRVVFDGYANHRVYAQQGRYPGLNMSRCLGDLLGHLDAGISAEPEIQEIEIKPLDHILFVCSDGVWEFMEPQEAARVVQAFSPSDGPRAAETLAKEAWDLWIREEGGSVVDDITVVLVYLQEVGKPQ